MTQLRERSHIFLWILLIFFILSMTVGGLVGGANILDLIFGGRNTQRYVGWIDRTGITHQQFIQERSRQLNLFRQQSRNIDSRTQQTASNNAWNAIVERVIKDNKIQTLGLEVQPDEIFDFLLQTPPPAFQNNVNALGFFVTEDGSFDLNVYQNAVTNGEIPKDLNPLLVQWENYLRVYLADRKLQSLYNATASVSDDEVKVAYIKQNINCTLDYLYVNANNIPDSLVTVTEDELLSKYNDDKDKLYALPERRSIEYVLWKVPINIQLDTTQYIPYQDSLMNLAMLFADEVDYSSFTDAIDLHGIEKVDSLNIHEEFNNNSGFPFMMGTVRSAVRFAFDSPIGSVSDPIQVENGIAIFHSLESLDEGYQTFENVINGIQRSIIRNTKKDYAQNLLESALTASDDWQVIADGNEFIELATGESSTVGGSFNTLGKSNELTGTIRAMDVDDVSSIVSTFTSVCILKMTAKDDFDDIAYTEVYDNIRTNLLANKQSQGYTNWLKDAKAASDIRDFRASSY